MSTRVLEASRSRWRSQQLQPLFSSSEASGPGLRPLFEADSADSRVLGDLKRWSRGPCRTFLQGLGCDIVYFPNPYEPFRQNRNADLQLPDPAPDFETTWQATTLLVSLVAARGPATLVDACELIRVKRRRPERLVRQRRQLGTEVRP